MNHILFLTILTLLGGASLWIGKKSSKAESKGDFFLMGRKLGLFSLIMTLLATQIGGGALMGAAEEAYSHGWIVICYPLGMVLGMIILGLGFGGRLRSLNLSTIAELFEKKYGSTRLRKVASLISIASLFFILVGQSIAARKFFLSMGYTHDVLFIAFWFVLVAYTVMGGLKAVVRTDIMQASFILVAFGIAFFSSTPTFASEAPILVPTQNAPWLTWLLMPLFFMLIEQDMGQRCFAAKTPRTISFGASIAALVLLIISLAPIYFGSLAARMGLAIPEGASVLVTSVQHFTNPFVSTLLVCAILMAVISTADSLLCSISSNLAFDFPSKNDSVLRCRLLTFGVGAASLALCYLFNNVVAMLMFSYMLSVSVLFVPTMMALFIKEPSKKAAGISMILGGVSFLLYQDHPIPFLFPLLYSLSGFILVELRARKAIKMTIGPSKLGQKKYGRRKSNSTKTS